MIKTLKKAGVKKFFFILLIFLSVFLLRLWNINLMGRGWDEPEYIEQGYKMDELLRQGDFSNSYFYTTYDHPPLVKYIYGLTAHLDLKTIKNDQPVFNYDYTYSRILSSFFASLSVVLVLLFAWEFFGLFVGVSSAIIFSTLPYFVGLSQLVTTESFLMFMFSASVYSFIRLLNKYSLSKVILTGILTGLALQVKQSNGLLFPLFILIYLLWFIKTRKQLKEKIINNRLISLFWIGVIAVAVFVVIWPMPYFHLDEISKINQKIWLVKTAPPVTFFGKLILSPVIYYIVMFFITTPSIIIALSLLGLKFIDRQKKWIYYSLIIWFLFPFIQSFYPWRQHGLRYIIEIYAPLSIIAGMGLALIISRFKNNLKTAKIISLIILLLYSLFILIKQSPYYLDYFNELVGGTKGIYEKRYFDLGWWGSGLREAGYYLKENAKQGSKVGLFISPPLSFPPIDGLRLIYINPNLQNSYSPKIKYDYVVVNDYHVLREGFNDSGIKRDYKRIFQVFSAGAPIVSIYKLK